MTSAKAEDSCVTQRRDAEMMEGLIAYIKSTLQKLQLVSNFRDVRILLYDLLMDTSQWLYEIRCGGGVTHARQHSFSHLQPKQQNDDPVQMLPNMLLNLHWSVRILLGAMVVSVLFQTIWMLQLAVWVVLFDQIMIITIHWIGYILDDPQLFFALRYLHGWLRRFLKESEYIVNHHDKNNVAATWKMGLAQAFLRQVPTGISVIRYWIYYRTFELRDQFLGEELGATRYIGPLYQDKTEFLPRGKHWLERYRKRKQHIRRG